MTVSPLPTAGVTPCATAEPGAAGANAAIGLFDLLLAGAPVVPMPLPQAPFTALPEDDLADDPESTDEAPLPLQEFALATLFQMVPPPPSPKVATVEAAPADAVAQSPDATRPAGDRPPLTEAPPLGMPEERVSRRAAVAPSRPVPAAPAVAAIAQPQPSQIPVEAGKAGVPKIAPPAMAEDGAPQRTPSAKVARPLAPDASSPRPARPANPLVSRIAPGVQTGAGSIGAVMAGRGTESPAAMPPAGIVGSMSAAPADSSGAIVPPVQAAAAPAIPGPVAGVAIPASSGATTGSPVRAAAPTGTVRPEATVAEPSPPVAALTPPVREAAFRGTPRVASNVPARTAAPAEIVPPAAESEIPESPRRVTSVATPAAPVVPILPANRNAGPPASAGSRAGFPVTLNTAEAAGTTSVSFASAEVRSAAIPPATAPGIVPAIAPAIAAPPVQPGAVLAVEEGTTIAPTPAPGLATRGEPDRTGAVFAETAVPAIPRSVGPEAKAAVDAAAPTPAKRLPRISPQPAKADVSLPGQPVEPRAPHTGMAVAKAAPEMNATVLSTPAPPKSATVSATPADFAAGAAASAGEAPTKRDFDAPGDHHSDRQPAGEGPDAGGLSTVSFTPSTGRSHEVAPLSEIAAARAVPLTAVLDEVGHGMARLREQGNSRLDLHLPLAGGGEVSIQLQLRDGAVHASVQTASAELREALQQGWNQLAARSESLGFRMAEPKFEAAAPGGMEFTDRQSRQEHRQPPAGEPLPQPFQTSPLRPQPRRLTTADRSPQAGINLWA